MQVLRGNLLNRSPLGQPTGVTIGKFDGVHRGHQQLLAELVSHCRHLNLPPAVLSFDPNPSYFFHPQSFQRLSTEESKIKKIEKAGVAHLFLQNFDMNFVDVSASDFLLKHLVPFFKPQVVLLGYDFSYGKGGEGNFELAQELLQPLGIKVYPGKAYEYDGAAISSSRIREALADGQVELVKELLGRYYSLQGRVMSGQKLGRQLGFPTANLSQLGSMVPGTGVYLVSLQWGGQRLYGVTNVGRRPTVGESPEIQVECHILDFKGDLYGENLELHFISRLRDEMYFSGQDQLVSQIKKDILKAKGLISKRG